MTHTAAPPSSTLEQVIEPLDTRDVRPQQIWWRAYVHHLRVLRNRSLAWIAVIAGVGAGVTAGFADLYPTQIQRDAMAASVEGVPAFEALFGRTVEMATLEGFVLWRWGGFAVLVVAVWGMLSASALLRGAEESHHLEPLRAGAISPRGLLAAALGAMFTWFATLAVVVGLTHSAAGMDVATAWVLGGALAFLAAVFAAAAALAAQVVDSRRRTNGVVGIVLGVTLLTRVIAASSTAPDWLWGATPFGWTTFLHASDGARPAVFASFAVVLTILTVGALALGRRDLHGARFVSDDSNESTRSIRGLGGLSVHTARGPALAWGSTLVISAIVFGLMAEDMAAAIGDLPETAEMAAQIGWVLDTPLGVVASMLVFLTFVLGLFASAQVAGIRDEEASWRIEPVLTRNVGRTQWLLVRTGVAATAIVIAAVAMAVASWVSAAVTGANLPVGDLPITVANLVPVAWMFLGLGVAVFGLIPRITAPVAYGMVLAAYVLDLVGGLLEIPEEILRYGPYRHVAAVPAADMSVGPALLMVAVGVAGTAVGVAAFRRRDLREA
jgi:ABC-2 type transport system permease protein